MVRVQLHVYSPITISSSQHGKMLMALLVVTLDSQTGDYPEIKIVLVMIALVYYACVVTVVI